MLSLLLLVSFATHVLAGLPDLTEHLERRQADCTATSCGWVTGLQSCSSSDVACVCRVLGTAGTAVSSCVSCLQTVNATLAGELSTIQQRCGSTLGVSPVASPTASVNSCSSPCSWFSGLQNCGTQDTACVCRLVNAAGSAVSSCHDCLLNVNATLAGELSTVHRDCLTEAGPIGTSATSGLETITAAPFTTSPQLTFLQTSQPATSTSKSDASRRYSDNVSSSWMGFGV